MTSFYYQVQSVTKSLSGNVGTDDNDTFRITELVPHNGVIEGLEGNDKVTINESASGWSLTQNNGIGFLNKYISKNEMPEYCSNDSLTNFESTQCTTASLENILIEEGPVTIQLDNIEEVIFIDDTLKIDTSKLNPTPEQETEPEKDPTPQPIQETEPDNQPPSSTPELTSKIKEGKRGLKEKITKISGRNKKDKLTGTNGPDKIWGYGGSDKINGKGGNDIIDPGKWTKGKFDIAKGGKGSDTFIIKEGYWVLIKDFDILEDKLNIKGLRGGLEWDYVKGKTYIWGKDAGVAEFKGKINLDNAELV